MISFIGIIKPVELTGEYVKIAVAKSIFGS